MSTGVRKSNRQKSMFWKPIPWNGRSNKSSSTRVVDHSTTLGKTEHSTQAGTHALVDSNENNYLRSYELDTKTKFDNIEPVIRAIVSQTDRTDFSHWAKNKIETHLGVVLDETDLDLHSNSNRQFAFQNLYANTLFKQFLAMSKDFFDNDPLDGQRTDEAQRIFKDAGIHAVGVAPCADGRMAHLISYVFRLPYAYARRKSHAGGIFDVSESVRNWVFIEHNRFILGQPNSAEEQTRYLKMAVYHFSEVDPSHQGCAAHGSDDHKAAESALLKLRDFRQAIETRFDCGSTIDTFLIGLNTDNDSLRIHIPDSDGKLALDRFIETRALYERTQGMTADDARHAIVTAIEKCNETTLSSQPEARIAKLIAWFVERNFSQIEYVNVFEQTSYKDIGHAERFIGIGNGFEEVQLRNLSYYSYLHTIEEATNDVDVGIKIFKGLNVKKAIPIPIIIRCDYDGRVPGSKTRAVEKAKRLESAIQERYKDLYACGLLKTMGTLRDYTGYKPAEKLRDSFSH